MGIVKDAALRLSAGADHVEREGSGLGLRLDPDA